MEIVLIDGQEWEQLKPLTYTRSVADIRIGILTIREKWEKYSGKKIQVFSKDYLSGKYPITQPSGEYLLVNSAVLPNKDLFKKLSTLKNGDALYQNGNRIALCTSASLKDHGKEQERTIEYRETVLKLNYSWDIFTNNKAALLADFELLTAGRKSQPLSSTNTVIGPGSVFLEEGAKAEASIFNTNDGPVYIGKNTEVMEGCMIRGAFSLGEDSQLKMGAKIYGATTIGPHCKVGGEVNNSVIFGYSNKAHDGFLGNSVIAEWCNLGADTNNSNLKNNYGIVKVYNAAKQDYISTGLQFCGITMGDHSKCGINTMFNTGTVIDVSANVFGEGFPEKHIPSFSWGNGRDRTAFEFGKAIELAKMVMSRRNLTLSNAEEDILRHIFENKGF